MSITGLVIALILAAAVLVIVLAPLLTHRPKTESVDDALAVRQRERLNAYYERALRNLRDLDEDHALGKIEPALYQSDRALWVERGVQALKALDSLDARVPLVPPASADTPDTVIDQAIDDAIEAAVQAAARRTQQSP